MMPGDVLFWKITGLALLGFGLGMLPFSLWLARLGAGADLRTAGDGNPGATNAWRVAGWKAGLAAYILDVAKAALPLGLAGQIVRVQGWPLLVLALMPTLGHIFSPLLKWRGGKGLATILGVWIGLSLWEVPLVILLALVIFKRLIRGDAWVIIFTEMFGLAYVLARQFSWVWATIFLFQLGLTFWTHRHEFGSAPRWRGRSS